MLRTLLAKLLGLAVLWGASWLMYDLVSSPEFNIGGVSVEGNRLVTSEEVESQAAVRGVNIFWVRRAELAQRLGMLAPVRVSEVSLELPDLLAVRVQEREPVAIWLANETPFLVDRDGRILAARPADRPLMTIRDTSTRPVAPGTLVAADAVRSVYDADRLLTLTFGSQPRQYEWFAESGLNVTQATGPRLILGNGDGLDWKVAAIQTIIHYLQAQQRTAELIDVRFRDRPYYR